MKKGKIFLGLIAVLSLAACNEPGSSVSPSGSEPSASTSASNSTSNSTSISTSSPSASVSAEPVKNYYDLVVNGGTGSQTHVLEGTEVTVVANEADTGYEFDCWKNAEDEVVSEEATYTFNLMGNVTLTANYKKLKYNIVVNGGTGSGVYEFEDEVTATATLGEGTGFVKWVDENGDDVSTENPYVFNATADVTISAVTKDLFVAPTSLEAFKTMLAKSAVAQNNTASVHYELADTKFTSSYSTKTVDEQATMYKDAVSIEGSQKEYSTYTYNRILKLENNKLKEVKKYSTSYPYSTAVSYSLVDSVTDASKEMTAESANAMVNSLGVVANISAIINNNEVFATEDSFTCVKNDSDNTYAISIKGHNETSTMYNVVEIEVVVGEDFFISSFTLTKKNYVKATSFDENNELKPDATPKDNASYVEKFTCVKGEGEKTVAPAETVDMTPYFISDFELKGRYYENGTNRVFDKDSNKIWKGAEITVSYIEPIANTITPSTYLESDDLNFVSVSDSNVLEVVYNSSQKPMTINAVGLGNATITMATSAGVEKTLSVEVVETLPPVSLAVDSLDKVLVNEQIELNVKDLKPSSADANVTWSVSDETLATIVEQDGKVYLKGLATGYVDVTVTSVTDNTVSATKTIFVSAGDLTDEQLNKVIVGKWLAGNTDETKAFIFEFKADGTLKITDNYRRATKITSTSNWTLSTELDGTQDHHNKVFDEDYTDYRVVKTANIVLDETVEGISSYLEIHFAIAKDGSKMISHFAIASDGGYQNQVMTKQEVDLSKNIPGEYSYTRSFDTDMDGTDDTVSTFTFKFNQDGSFELIDNYRANNKINCTGKWALTKNVDSTKTHNDSGDTELADSLTAIANNAVIEINDLVISEGEKQTSYLDIHFVISEDGSTIVAHIRVSETAKTLSYVLTKA